MLLLCGVCVGATPWYANVGDLFAQSGMAVPETPPGVSLEQMFRIVYTTIGVVGGLFGLALIGLSFPIRRGTTPPAVLSLVLESIVAIMLLLNLIVPLSQAASDPLTAIFALLIIGVLLAVFGLNIAWLIAAIRNAPRVRMAQHQYQAQYHQYQQYQQAYGQGGMYGMPYAPTQTYGYYGQQEQQQEQPQQPPPMQQQEPGPTPQQSPPSGPPPGG